MQTRYPSLRILHVIPKLQRDVGRGIDSGPFSSCTNPALYSKPCLSLFHPKTKKEPLRSLFPVLRPQICRPPSCREGVIVSDLRVVSLKLLNEEVCRLRSVRVILQHACLSLMAAFVSEASALASHPQLVILPSGIANRIFLLPKHPQLGSERCCLAEELRTSSFAWPR